MSKMSVPFEHAFELGLVSGVLEQEEFEWAVVGAELAARHALKVAPNDVWLEPVLRAMPKSAVLESRLARGLGRPPELLTAQRELPQEPRLTSCLAPAV